MLILPITRNWLFSETARRAYFFAALLAIAYFGTLIGVKAALSGVTSIPPLTASLIKVLIFPGVAGTAVLYVGMWYFWFGFDDSHYLKKALWFVALNFLVPVATVVYYFVVYRGHMQLPMKAYDPLNGKSS